MIKMACTFDKLL